MSSTLHAHPISTVAAPASASRRPAYLLSAVVATVMAAASVGGLAVLDLYQEGPWAREALRGGDLVTLTIATPLLVGSMVAAARGSTRALLVWAAVLAYDVYNYAYYTFGAHFNDLFLAHIALLGLSTWALVFLLASLDMRELAARFRIGTALRVGAALVLSVVGAGLTTVWTDAIVRQAVTGVLPLDSAGPEQLHTVYAVDLAVFVPMLVVPAWLLWRSHPWGTVGGTVVSLASAAYLINLMAAQAFQAAAGVPGVEAFSLLSASLVSACTAAGLALLHALRREG